MSFLTPLALLGALIALPILLLYMLRLRRREVVVSSNFLWQQILEDTEANTPWQRLRRNALLLLQLLILALLVLALMRPFIVVPTLSAGQSVILLDASASMNATDLPGGRSRFEAAQDEALNLINQMGAGDTYSVVRVADVTQPLIPYTRDVNALRQAVRDAQPGYGGGDWQTALTLAAAGAAGAENFSIVIISDGGITGNTSLPPNIPEPAYIPVGQSADNLALTALATRSRVGDNAPQLFAQVRNYRAEDAEVSLVIRLDGALWESITRTISGRSSRSFVFEIDQPYTLIEAELIQEDGALDHLAADDLAWAVAENAATRRVLLMSEANLFIDQVLRSLPDVQTFRGDTTRDTLPGRAYDLYILNAWLPEVLPPADMLIINPPRSTALFTLGDETAETGNLRAVRRDDPRLAFVDVENVSLRALRPVNGADWGEVLITTDGGPVLLAGEAEGQQIALLPFDVRDSDLPLQIAWPVLMSNLLDWFTPADVIVAAGSLSVGDAVPIRPPLDAASLRITAPDGEVHELAVHSRSMTFTETHRPGLYTLQAFAQDGEQLMERPFAVNLFALDESDLAPVTGGLALGGGATLSEDNAQEGVREFWPWLALLALLVLLIEWYVYHRRLRVPTVMAPRRTAQRLGA